MTKFTGFVGTYTKGDSKGVYSFTLDTDLGKISETKLVAELENPTYITTSKDHQTLYAVLKQGEFGGVAAYEMNTLTGELKLKNKQVSEGASPCHISVNSHDTSVVTAHYHRGTVELYSITNGEVKPASSTIQHFGTGPNQERQEKPHVHYAGFTPDEKYVVTVDLGTDKISTYEIKDNELVHVDTLSVKPGSGPRHITFHPNGKVAYVMTELSNEVIVLSYNPENGSFSEGTYISTLPSDFNELSQGGAIHISSDGRFVYVSNRGHNSIASFSVDQGTYELTFIEHTSTEGNWPRDFVLDPTEQFIVSSNQESHNLVLYARDKETGKLQLLQSTASVPYPVCIAFVGE